MAEGSGSGFRALGLWGLGFRATSGFNLGLRASDFQVRS